jgi:hypothetical protein
MGIYIPFVRHLCALCAPCHRDFFGDINDVRLVRLVRLLPAKRFFGGLVDGLSTAGGAPLALSPSLFFLLIKQHKGAQGGKRLFRNEKSCAP